MLQLVWGKRSVKEGNNRWGLFFNSSKDIVEYLGERMGRDRKVERKWWRFQWWWVLSDKEFSGDKDEHFETHGSSVFDTMEKESTIALFSAAT